MCCACANVTENINIFPMGPKLRHPAVLFVLVCGLRFAQEESPRLDVVKPVGHSTHNLFVRDKKNKDAFFLISLRQDRELNLAALAKLCGTKEIRFAAPEDTRSLYVLCVLGVVDVRFLASVTTVCASPLSARAHSACHP